MLRTPRSLNVHAMVEPTGDAIRLSGVGRLRTCSTENGEGPGVCAMPPAPATPATVEHAIRAGTNRRRRIVGGLYAAALRIPVRLKADTTYGFCRHRRIELRRRQLS